MTVSLLGSIGHVMKGSRLEDALGVLLGPNTVVHVLSGKAYTRAVRGHFIIYKALSDLLLDYLKCQQVVEDDGNDDVCQVPVCLHDTNHLLGSLIPSILSDLNDLYSKILHDGYTDDEQLHDTSLPKASQLLDELKSINPSIALKQ